MAAALDQGTSPADLYVDVVAGALDSVGEEWMLGCVDVAAEHVATATAGRLLSRLSASIEVVPSHGTVVLATPPGEHHGMPVFVLSEVLRLAGYRTNYLGADVPLASLVAAAQRAPELVAVCLGATVVGPQVLAEAVGAVREAVPGVEVFVGGRAVPDERTAVAMGASGWATDARDVPSLLPGRSVTPSADPPTPRPVDDLVRRLQTITDAALAHLDLDDLLDEVTSQTVAALNADTMAIFLRDGDELVSRATRCPDGVLREDVRMPIGVGVAGRIAEHRGPTLIDDLASAEPSSSLVVRYGVQSVVGVPLVLDDQLIGAVHVGSRRLGHFADGDARFLQLVADRVALAVDRARLFEAERAARTLAESSQRRLAFLTAVGEALARTLDWHELLETVVSRSVPFLADWCAVDFVHDDGRLRCAAAAHRDASLVALVREVHDSRPPPEDEARGVGHVLATGEPRFWPTVSQDGLAAVARTTERLAMLRTLAPSSVMIVPLVVRGEMLGAVTFVHSTSGRSYSELDLDLASEVVRRLGVALDHARLFEERSAVARTLQESLLPPHLPAIEGAELAALFEPGGEGVEVGGDFYDVFATEADDWALVVGDVCGKGAEAAAVTALGRYTLRAAAMGARRPSRVLHVLNEAMLRSETARPFLTVAYARLQLGGGSARLTVGCAGHPMPLVLRASGAVEAVGRPGMLLGCFGEFDVEDVSVELLPGDSVVLYTDGVEEARDEAGAVLGPDGLQALLAECVGLSAAAISEWVLDAARSRRAGRAADDAAVLTLRLV